MNTPGKAYKSVGIAIKGQRGQALCSVLSEFADYKVSWSLSPANNDGSGSKEFLNLVSDKFYSISGPAELKLIGSNLAKVDYLICAGFPYKLPKQVLETATVLAINCHGGPLPNYRGGSPVNWQIINNEKYIGLTIHELSPEFDQGDILMEKNLVNSHQLDISAVHEVVNAAFKEMLKLFLSNPVPYTKSKKPQDVKHARYWHQRNEFDGLIDWNRLTAENVYHFVRAISAPYPGGYNFLSDGKILRTWRVEIDKVPVLGIPGRVVLLADGVHVVAAERSSVKLLKIDCQRKLAHGDFLDSVSRLR